jgi:hypothetical protein
MAKVSPSYLHLWHKRKASRRCVRQTQELVLMGRNSWASNAAPASRWQWARVLEWLVSQALAAFPPRNGALYRESR